MSAAGKRPPKPVLVAVILVLVAIGGYVGWRLAQGSQDTDLGVSGVVEARQYQVAAAIAGSITKVHVAEGAEVTSGQALVTLDDRALRLQVDQAGEGVNAAKAAVVQARDNGDSAEVSAAQARVKQAEAAQAIAKVQLGYASVQAPHAGRVDTVNTNAGQIAGPGRTLLTITDPADLFLRVYVPEPQLGAVRLGDSARVSADGLQTPIDGRVSFVATSAEFSPNTVQTQDQRVNLVYEVRVQVTDDSGVLKPGLPVEVTFR